MANVIYPDKVAKPFLAPPSSTSLLGRPPQSELTVYGADQIRMPRDIAMPKQHEQSEELQYQHLCLQ